ncbi:HutD/Ves family protein [Acidisoma sp. 7E03]
MSGWRIVPAAGFQPMAWRNGGGTTWEIARGLFPGGPAADWHWRFSLAEIAQDGPFSAFPSIDRRLTLLSGTGIDLTFAGAPPRRLGPLEDIEFPGEAAVDCKLVDGPTRDLNVMVDRRAARLVPGRVEADIHLRQGDLALLYALEAVTVRDDMKRITLAAGDAAVAEGGMLGVIEQGRAIWAKLERLTA